MAQFGRGLYERLITEEAEAALNGLGVQLVPSRSKLRDAEAADRIALHLSRVLRRSLESVAMDERGAIGIAIARKLIEQIADEIDGADARSERPIEPGSVLRSIALRLPDTSPESIQEPLIPLLDTTLLTNSPDEPRVGRQLLAELHSSDRVDVVMAFIRWSGVVPLLDAIRAHCEAGRPLRVLTTSYTGSTEARAVDELRRVGAEVRVSYDTSTTRLHAKAWLFLRRSGYSTAYIGSSNLTHSAQVDGLEWNVRVSGARNPDVIGKVSAVFDAYWNSGDFVPYDRDEFTARTEAESQRGAPHVLLPPTELRLEAFQERILEQIALSRRLGHHRNLLAAATGTGKTVMAAVDYARLRESLPRARLLFVAHRAEILEQSLATFRHGLRDPAFGELWVGGRRPQEYDHVFASIQSLNAAGLSALQPDHFDVVIVDEFHHAAAPSYRALLEHVRPIELLGLTATPERSDGLPVLDWFGQRIAAELRLWDAIDQHRLCPFSYYGIYDGVDLRHVPWRRGHGYDVQGLSNLLTADDAWARLVLAQLDKHVSDVARMRALGFCVSVEHARFMERVFREAGIAAKAVWADTPEAERRAALADLQARRINVVFSVDLFNEGVDVPSVDTLLFLRPTDSPTLFLQQLGRGLRTGPGKTTCTVLDFVGRHRKEFRFDRRLRALLGGSRKHVERQVEEGFPFLPAGCHLELDRVATEIVLRSIREATPSQWPAKVEDLRQLARRGPVPSLAHYLQETGLELEDVYSGKKSWSDLLADAGQPIERAGPHEAELRRACGRLLHIDDLSRIESYRGLLTRGSALDIASLNVPQRRLLRMLVSSVAGPVADPAMSLEAGWVLIQEHPQVRAEILELLDVLAGRIEHLPIGLPSHGEVPLQVHARYTRIEVLAAFGVGDGARVALWQTGVYDVEGTSAILLAFTLDKTTGQFSPTTRYRDYAINRDLIHWESQSATRANSELGLRYQQHAALGTSIMLFARIRSDDRAFTFLGPATYVAHESEMPMAITWRLAFPLPGDLLAAYAAAVA